MLSEKEVKKITDSVKDEGKSKDYAFLITMDNVQMEYIQEIILLDYERNPDIFSEEAKEIIKNSLVENVRWKDFDTVVERLNAPALVSYYETQRFSYQYYPGPMKFPKTIFKSRKANCVDYSYFTVHCLSKAGYETGTIRVAGRSWEGHMIAYCKDKGKILIIDNGRIGGPFTSFYKSPYYIKEIIRHY